MLLQLPAHAEPDDPPPKTWLKPDTHLHDALQRSGQNLTNTSAPYTIGGGDWLNDGDADADTADDEESGPPPVSAAGPCLSLTFDKIHNHAFDPKPQSVVWLAPDASPCQPGAFQAEPRGLALQPKVDRMLAQAMQYLGTPYKSGGASPGKGFDCSGFVYYNFQQIGIEMPRTAHEQYLKTAPVARAELQPGDLVFFQIRRSQRITHVGIYIGKNRFIHAPSRNKDVQITSLDDSYWNKRFVRGGRLEGTA